MRGKKKSSLIIPRKGFRSGDVLQLPTGKSVHDTFSNGFLPVGEQMVILAEGRVTWSKGHCVAQDSKLSKAVSVAIELFYIYIAFELCGITCKVHR